MDKKLICISEYIVLFFAFCQLAISDAYYFPYLLVFGVSALAIHINRKSGVRFSLQSKNTKVVIFLFSILLSGFIWLSNYRLWLDIAMPDGYGYIFSFGYKALMSLIIFGGCYIAFLNLFILIYRMCAVEVLCENDMLKESQLSIVWRRNTYHLKASMVFCVSFISLVVVYNCVLIFCKYPGNLTYDSLIQIGQTVSGEYTNHHPVVHTLLIELFLRMGISLFGNINAGVALYSFISIVFMSLCFSFSVMTMFQLGAPSTMILISLLVYLFTPYHIMYSFTMWKDVPFAGFVLVLVLSLFRYSEWIGNKIVNLMLFWVSGVGMCLFRSNGFFAFGIFAIAIFLMLIISNKKDIWLFVIVLSVIIVSFASKNIVIGALEIPQADLIEKLAIPVQQISRVIVDKNDLTEDEYEMIESVIEVESVRNLYNICDVDPVKYAVRDKGNQNLISANANDYLKMYIRIGLRHPDSYIRAWVDQTRGFWNAGYFYWCWADGIDENNYGIRREIKSETINRLVNEYFMIFNDMRGFKLIFCIGLVVWIFFIALYIGIIRKDMVGILICIPVLALLLSLLIATPLSHEFRYMYSAFCILPFLIGAMTRPMRNEEIHRVDDLERNDLWKHGITKY